MMIVEPVISRANGWKKSLSIIDNDDDSHERALAIFTDQIR